MRLHLQPLSQSRAAGQRAPTLLHLGQRGLGTAVAQVSAAEAWQVLAARASSELFPCMDRETETWPGEANLRACGSAPCLAGSNTVLERSAGTALPGQRRGSRGNCRTRCCVRGRAGWAPRCNMCSGAALPPGCSSWSCAHKPRQKTPRLLPLHRGPFPSTRSTRTGLVSAMRSLTSRQGSAAVRLPPSRTYTRHWTLHLPGKEN